MAILKLIYNQTEFEYGLSKITEIEKYIIYDNDHLQECMHCGMVVASIR
jgi:hypothetical protein